MLATYKHWVVLLPHQQFYSLWIRHFSRLDGYSKLNCGCLCTKKPKINFYSKKITMYSCIQKYGLKIQTRYLASSGFKSRPLEITVYRKKLLETIIIQEESKLNALPCSIIDKEISSFFCLLSLSSNLTNNNF